MDRIRTTLARLHGGQERTEEGFTLIELMIVVLIIGVLLAIAVPTFLGAQNRAKERSPQTSLDTSLQGAKVVFSDDSDFGTAAALVTALTAAEPALTFTAAASADPKNVSVRTYDTDSAGPATDAVLLVARSANGKCFAIWDNEVTGGGVKYAKATSTSTCNAASFGAVAAATPAVVVPPAVPAAGGWSAYTDKF